MRTFRLRAKIEKEEQVAQLLQLRAKYDKVVGRMRGLESSSSNDRDLERYLRKLEERQVKLERELKKVKKTPSSLPSYSLPVEGNLRVVAFTFFGVVVVFLPELLKLPPNSFPPNLSLLASFPIDWQGCIDRFGVFSMTILLLHIIAGTSSLPNGRKSKLSTLLTEGAVVWCLGVVVKSFVGIAEAIATTVLITTCGLLLRSDLDVTRIKFPVVEDSGDVENWSLGNVLAPLALSILTSPHIDQVNGRAKDNRGQFAAVNSPQQLSPRTAAWLTNPPRLAAYGAHIFDHREALKQTRQSLHNPPPARRGSSPSNSAPRNSAPNTPSPMSAKQKKELEVLNKVIPVTNKDTGETVDLKFLEQLTEQCNVFQNHRSSSESDFYPHYSPQKFSTPPPNSHRRSSARAAYSSYSGGAKRPSLMKRLANGGVQGGSAMKEKLKRAVGK